jgi:uncharacterized membrane protein YczE
VPDRPSWIRRFVQLQVGLFFFGVALALILEAHIGLDPWSCFQEGVSLRSGLSFGRVTQLIGLVIIVLAWMFLEERPGLGTVCNMLTIGPWIDFFRAQAWFPEQEAWLAGLAQFLTGLLLLGLASGLYISARFGAGPRDGLVLGFVRRTGISIRTTRVVLELTLLVAGWLLGGAVGLGTIVFALLMGPLMQRSLELFRFSPAQRREGSSGPGDSESGTTSTSTPKSSR